MAKSQELSVLPYNRLMPERTALLVIDMQRYFVHPEHPFGKYLHQSDPTGTEAYFERVRHLVIPNIQRLQEGFRSLGACIVYTEFGSMRRDGRDMPGWARRHNDLGCQMLDTVVFPPFDDPTCRVDDSIAPHAGELVFQKTTSGPVNSTKLDQTLRVLNIDTVVVTGVVTDVCVAQTAREFADRDFNAFVVEDACAATEENRHKTTLDTIGGVFGTVVSTEQVLALLSGE